MASSRHTGTNESVSTYDSGGGKDYSALTDWEQATDITLTSGFEQVSISNVSATRFDIAESLSFSSSGATATCYGTSLARDKMYYVVTGGTPTTADTITGDTTGATADIDTIDSTNTGVSFVLECYSSQTHNDSVVISSATVDASYFRIIRPAGTRGVDWQGHSGIPLTDGSVVYFNKSGGADTVVFSIQEDYVQIQDLVIELDTSAAAGTVYGVFFNNSYDYMAAVGCMVLNGSTGGASMSGFSGYDNHYFIDCLAHNITAGAGKGFRPLGVSYFYNCTATYCDRGFDESSASNPIVKNCISSHNATDWFGTWDTTTCTVENDEPTYVNSGSDDFHLASGDTVAKGNGTNLDGSAPESESVYPFDDDIDGATISDWPIGFDEPVPAIVYAEILTQEVIFRDIIEVVNY